MTGIDTDKKRIIDLLHPIYEANVMEWRLWRDTYESGTNFINRYLVQISKREDAADFEERKKVTYCPAFAKAAIEDVKNSIFQRMIDISRDGGTLSYQNAIESKDGGVDLAGSSMNYFIGQDILPEMLVMQKVGVYVDMPPVNGETLLDIVEENIRPYLYVYKVEEICNWVIDCSCEPHEYKRLLLKETYEAIDSEFDLPCGTATRYRFMYIGEDGYCYCEFYSDEGNQTDQFNNPSYEPIRLNIKKIPFVIFEISHSLLTDIARYQIALLNMNSSDVMYILKSNFPFYTEQRDFRASTPYVKSSNDEEAQPTSGTKEIVVGPTSGRAYGPGMERPGFINPSIEPLKASMEKEDQLKMEIRQLVNLALTNLSPTKQASAESKSLDNQGLEAGLSYIGLELEKGESRIAEFWSMYENSKNIATISYPTRYSLKDDSERRKEAKDYIEMLPTVPSKTFQKEIAKSIAGTLLGYKISTRTLDTIEREIDSAEIISVDPELIRSDVEVGILDKENAAKARFYPEDAVEKANKEHAERLGEIAKSQSDAANIKAGARGVNDESANPAVDAKEEKTESRDSTKDPLATRKTRGEGK